MIIITPVKEDPAVFHEFIERNKEVLSEHHWIVVDSGGGGEVEGKVEYYEAKTLNREEARRFGIEKAAHLRGDFVLNLDSDVALPEGYIDEALMLLQDSEVGAVSTFFTNKEHAGVLEFGCSVWRKDLLASLYDWNTQVNGSICECVYMWRKLNANGFKILNLTRKAEHLTGL